MKVLQINAVNQYGSTGRNVYEISEYLNGHGNEGIVACAKATGAEHEYVIGTVLDHKLHALLSRITGKQGYFSKKPTQKLIQYIQQEQPDIVHINNIHSNYINMPLLLEYLSKQQLPTVITLHDCWFYTGHCFHYDRIHCEKWKTGCEHCPKIHEGNASWFFDTSKRVWKDKKNLLQGHSDLAIVGVSDWITGEVQKSILSSAKYITRIYNWIDIEKFCPRSEEEKSASRKQYGLAESDIVILGVASRWDTYKGILKFLELADRLPEHMKIVLVGTVPEEYRKNEGILYIPQTESVEKLADIYSMTDVFLNLSEEESFGKVSAESLACGTPVVCMNRTANPELVGEGCGIVLTDGKNENIVKAIIEITEHREIYNRKKCRDFAVQNFEKNKQIQEYIALYREMLKLKSV